MQNNIPPTGFVLGPAKMHHRVLALATGLEAHPHNLGNGWVKRSIGVVLGFVLRLGLLQR